jgi:hypothetical protein
MKAVGRRAVLFLWMIPACGGGESGDVDAGVPPDGAAVDGAAVDGPVCETGAPINLTETSPSEDEDPTLIRAADGRFVLVHFAWRDGNADLFALTSADGQAWSAPVRITTDVQPDYAPSLIQDSGGRFHLAWYRQGPAPGYFTDIHYTSTTDPAVWDPADETAATSSSVRARNGR